MLPLDQECIKADSSQHNLGKGVRSGGSYWGTLVFTLALSRLLGVAPVRFQTKKPGCPFTVSKSLSIYSRSIIIILHAGLLAGTCMDLQLGSHGVRTRSVWTSFAWLFELSLLMFATTVGAFGAPKRLRLTILYLNTIDKIKSNIGFPGVYEKTHFYLFATVLYITSAIILHAVDFYTFYVDSVTGGQNYYVMYFYSCFYCELIILILLELQFMWVAMFAESGLKFINMALDDLIYIIDLQRNKTSVTVEDFLNSETNNIPLQTKHVNTLVDTMTLHESLQFEQQPPTSKYVLQKIRELVLAYSTVCDVIAGINNHYGLLLLLFILNFILHFVVTPLYFISFLYSNKPRNVNVIVQIIFIIFHISFMMIVVEPAYLTEKQNEDTIMLAQRLLRRATSTQDPILAELDLLLKHIGLNKVYYAPLNFCRLSRSLIAVILGGATSYVLIILQFQKINEDG